MERTVIRFVRLLRREGLRVSPSETLDAVRALAATGLAERARARAALRLTLAKSEAELGHFDELFDRFFGGAAPAGGRASSERAEGAIAAAVQGKFSVAS